MGSPSEIILQPTQWRRKGIPNYLGLFYFRLQLSKESSLLRGDILHPPSAMGLWREMLQYCDSSEALWECRQGGLEKAPLSVTQLLQTVSLLRDGGNQRHGAQELHNYCLSWSLLQTCSPKPILGMQTVSCAWREAECLQWNQTLVDVLDAPLHHHTQVTSWARGGKIWTYLNFIA